MILASDKSVGICVPVYLLCTYEVHSLRLTLPRAAAILCTCVPFLPFDVIKVGNGWSMGKKKKRYTRYTIPLYPYSPKGWSCVPTRYTLGTQRYTKKPGSLAGQ